jgi:hypothetical protein
MRPTKVLLFIMGLGLLAAFGLPLASFLLPLWIGAPELASGAAWLSVIFGLGLYPCALAIERGKHRVWMISGLVAGGLAYAIWVQAIFMLPMMTRDLSQLMVQLATPPTGWAAFASFTGALVLLRTTAGWARVVRRGTIWVGAVCALVTVASINFYSMVESSWSWQERRFYEETAARVGGVLAILSGTGLVVVLLASIGPRLGSGSVPRSERLSLTVTCPRCGRRQRIVTDGDACSECGLRITVTPT